MSKSDFADVKLCIPCRKKNPPVKTVLKIGENITESRWKSGYFCCNDCNRLKQKNSRERNKEIWAKYIREKDELDLEQFEQEWNDPEFKGVKELTDKVVKVFNKYHRRSSAVGLKRETICAVIFPDLWNAYIDRVIEDLLNLRSDSKLIRLRHKEILMLYIPQVIDRFREYYKRKAINAWAGLVQAVNHKYVGKEKLLCRPEFLDEKTQIHEKRWHLLTERKELEERDAIHEAQKEQIDRTMNIEDIIVAEHEAKEQEIRKKADLEADKDQDSDDEGGE